jgi:hypothetical protein
MVERNRKAGQNPPRVVAPIEEEEVFGSIYVYTYIYMYVYMYIQICVYIYIFVCVYFID